MGHSSNAALEHAANSVMQAKCDSVMSTLQNIDANGKTLIDSLLESLAAESTTSAEMNTRIKTILTAVTPPGYVASLVVEGTDHKFEVNIGKGELRYQRIYEVTLGEIGPGLWKARVFVHFYKL